MDPMAGYAWLTEGREISAEESRGLEGHDPPRHVLVTGHGRGGTTAVARALVALGFETDGGNPFLESVPLRTLNKQRDGDALLDAVRAWDSRPQRLFYKDPKLRAAHTIPLLPQMPDSVGFLFVFRDPLNIAIRNHALGEIGLGAALGHAVQGYRSQLQAIEAVRHRKVMLISYEKLLVAPAVVIGGLAGFLGVDDDGAIADAVSQIEPNSADYRQVVAESKRTMTLPEAG